MIFTPCHTHLIQLAESVSVYRPNVERMDTMRIDRVPKDSTLLAAMSSVDDISVGRVDRVSMETCEQVSVEFFRKVRSSASQHWR